MHFRASGWNKFVNFTIEIYLCEKKCGSVMTRERIKKPAQNCIALINKQLNIKLNWKSEVECWMLNWVLDGNWLQVAERKKINVKMAVKKWKTS